MLHTEFPQNISQSFFNFYLSAYKHAERLPTYTAYNNFSAAYRRTSETSD